MIATIPSIIMRPSPSMPQHFLMMAAATLAAMSFRTTLKGSIGGTSGFRKT